MDGERADDPCVSRERSVDVLRSLGTTDWVLNTDGSAVECAMWWCWCSGDKG